MRVSMVVAERSGDQLAALLLKGMQGVWPGMESCGIGGPQMQALGFQSWWSCDELSVRGLTEALARYRRITSIRQQLIDRLIADKPDVFVGVDASDFNLMVEKQLGQHGVQAVQLVCPSIWAWRPERVSKIRESVKHILCLYPFEPGLLAQHGIEGTYVGHPVADVIPLEPNRLKARLELGIEPEAEVVALLPGRRTAEIKYLLKPFLQAARLMRQQRPKLQFLLPTHEALFPLVERAISELGLTNAIQLVQGRSHEVQAACNVALVASGTATLETALFKRPMVIAYRMQWLSWRMDNQKRLLPWVGLPNILCNEALVPEFLQDEIDPLSLAHSVLSWFDHPEAVVDLQKRFTQLHLELRQDMPTKSIHAIQKFLHG